MHWKDDLSPEQREMLEYFEPLVIKDEQARIVQMLRDFADAIEQGPQRGRRLRNPQAPADSPDFVKTYSTNFEDETELTFPSSFRDTDISAERAMAMAIENAHEG